MVEPNSVPHSMHEAWPGAGGSGALTGSLAENRNKQKTLFQFLPHHLRVKDAVHIQVVAEH